jgi:hypothetical protein
MTCEYVQAWKHLILFFYFLSITGFKKGNNIFKNGKEHGTLSHGIFLLYVIRVRFGYNLEKSFNNSLLLFERRQPRRKRAALNTIKVIPLQTHSYRKTQSSLLSPPLFGRPFSGIL